MNLEFITAPQNLPFAVSIGLFLFMAMLEGLGALVGFGLSSLLDSIDLGFDLDAEVGSGDIGAGSLGGGFLGGFAQFLAWLRFGKVPALIFFLVFLTCFGISGFVIQATSLSILGSLFSASVASIITLLVTFPLLRITAGLLSDLLPNDETSALSEESFKGRQVSIVLGSATKGSAAQAKFQDDYGQTHYLMIEPSDEDVVFEQEEVVEILEKCGAVFTAKKISKEKTKKEVLLETV